MKLSLLLNLGISLMEGPKPIKDHTLSVARYVNWFLNPLFINSPCKVLNELQKSGCKYLVNIVGNHELYNFRREELAETLGILRDGSSWYSFKPWDDISLRFVVLDGYDISTIEGLDEMKTSEAKGFLKKHNPNDIETFGVEWSKGLEGEDKRFMPYNGMIGEEQMQWFQQTLKESSESKESVIILTHVPIHPKAADNLCLLWNYKEVLGVIKENPCVAAVLAGHDHEVHTKL